MKIFNLSLCKSGTTSLEHFLVNTYNIKQYPYIPKFYDNKKIHNDIFEKKKFESIIDVDSYDLFSDIPFNLFDSFKFFNEKYPESIFILIIRNFNDWFESNIKWRIKIGNSKNSRAFGNKFDEYQYYGCNFKNRNQKNIVKKAYDDYHNSIFEYFKNKKDKLLVMNLNDINTNMIYNFVNLPIKKKIKFEHKNKNSK